jgi:hypothetical protein
VMARKIGTVPTGSVITSRVTKLLAKGTCRPLGSAPLDRLGERFQPCSAERSAQ